MPVHDFDAVPCSLLAGVTGLVVSSRGIMADRLTPSEEDVNPPVGDAGIEPANACTRNKWPTLSLISDANLVRAEGIEPHSQGQSLCCPSHWTTPE